MDGQLDKVQNKTRCICGENSVHGVYDENVKIGEYCEKCFVTYLESNYPDSDYLRIKKRPTPRAPDKGGRRLRPGVQT